MQVSNYSHAQRSCLAAFSNDVPATNAQGRDYFALRQVDMCYLTSYANTTCSHVACSGIQHCQRDVYVLRQDGSPSCREISIPLLFAHHSLKHFTRTIFLTLLLWVSWPYLPTFFGSSSTGSELPAGLKGSPGLTRSTEHGEMPTNKDSFPVS